MTPNPALDNVIRRARYLLFALDGPIRSVNPEKPGDSTAPTAPHIYDALAACRESGRSAAVISADPPTDVRAYLYANELTSQIVVIASSVDQAASALAAIPAECTFITSSAGEIEGIQSAGTSTIAYAKTQDDADLLVEAGASAVIYSMADLALILRAQDPS